MNNIEQYYNNAYDEWSRLLRHRIEFEMTKRMLDKYIHQGSFVLDVGGGPGRYSIYLAQRGHEVTLADLCEKMVEQAAQNSKEAGISVKCVQCNALDLDKKFQGSNFDVVLCMGPMYHLLEESQREAAINQCLGLLKKGGTLFVSFISAYAPIVDCLKEYPQDVSRLKSSFLGYLEDGRHAFDINNGFTDAYFYNPAHIEGFMSKFNLETLKITAVEVLGAMVEKSLMKLPEEDFQSWMDVFEAISSNPEVLGCCEHLLYIGRKR